MEKEVYLLKVRDKEPQYSKRLVFSAVVIMVVGILLTAIFTVLFNLDSTFGVAIVGVCGTLGITAIVWYMKKSQAENTIKLYMGSYKEILRMKKEMFPNENPSYIIDEMESKMRYNLDSTLDNHLTEGVSPIERVDSFMM